MEGLRGVSLSVLDLSDNPRLFRTNTQAAVKALCGCLSEQNGMERLGLRGCGFTSEVGQIVAKETGGHRFSVEKVETDD